MWRRLPAVLSLFVLSPLVAEYLLGSLPVAMIGILPVMALMYGSAAVLIREVARRAGRGWVSIALLACAYGFIEEGLVTQSLFNPNYLGLRLLDFGFMPALGTALPWLIYVISIHVVWSICVPIGLVESLFPAKRDEPWLGPIGIGVFSLLLVAGCGLVAIFTYKQRPFMASWVQLTSTALIVAALIAVALKWPAAKRGTAPAPHAIVLFLAALIFGSALMVLQQLAQARLHWNPIECVLAIVALQAAFIGFMTVFTRGKVWNDRQRFALMAGGFLTYAWIGFPLDVELHGKADLHAHAILAAMMCLVLAIAGYRCFKSSKCQPESAEREPKESSMRSTSTASLT
jgi:uncharacterized membrane protein SirB2